VDDAEKFCAWCLSDFRWKDEHTPSAISFSGRTIPCIGETVMMAPAQGFYTTPDMGRDQVRLAYVLCREDFRRSIFILEKALEEYNR